MHSIVTTVYQCPNQVWEKCILVFINAWKDLQREDLEREGEIVKDGVEGGGEVDAGVAGDVVDSAEEHKGVGVMVSAVA